MSQALLVQNKYLLATTFEFIYITMECKKRGKKKTVYKYLAGKTIQVS